MSKALIVPLGHSVHAGLRKFSGRIDMWNASFCDALFQYQVISDLQVKSAAVSNLFLCWCGALLFGTAEHCALSESQF